jgi:hypothetical protein
MQLGCCLLERLVHGVNPLQTKDAGLRLAADLCLQVHCWQSHEYVSPHHA